MGIRLVSDILVYAISSLFHLIQIYLLLNRAAEYQIFKMSNLKLIHLNNDVM